MESKSEDQKPSQTFESLLEEIQNLEKQLKKHETEENLTEASKTYKKLEKLKKTLKSRQKQEKSAKVLKDKKLTDEAFSTQVTAFNSEWDDKKKKLLQDLKKEEEKLREKHKSLKNSLQETVFKSFSEKAKPDTHQLHLKQTKAALTKQKDYDKAMEYEQKIKAYSSQLQAKHEEQKNQKLQIESERLEKNFQRDLENFHKRKKLDIFEFERKRQKELEFLNKRYKNTSNDLLLSQKTLKRRLSENEKIVKQGKPNSPSVDIKADVSAEKSQTVEDSTLSQVNLEST